MTEIERNPDEVNEAAKNMESVETRQLDDATFEPGSLLEQKGDYRQAEDIQQSLEQVVNEQGPPAGEAGQPIEFEKPILNNDMKNQGSGPDVFGDVGDQIPGQGKLEEDMGDDLLEGMQGLEGFTGTPADLRNDAEGSQPPGRDIPGVGGPFAPGRGPNAGVEAGGGGNSRGDSTLHDDRLQEYLKNEADGKTMREAHDAEYHLVSPIFNSGKNEAIPDNEADRILEAARDAHKPQQVDDPEVPPDQKDEPPDGAGGRDSSVPIRDQLTGKQPSQKYDADLISNYPEGHDSGTQTGGTINADHAETLKKSLDHKAQVEHMKPRLKTEQVTDPSGPREGQKSDTGG